MDLHLGLKLYLFFLNDETTYLDNLDYKYIKFFSKKNNLTNYIFFIISKSGDTFETLALLNLLIFESERYEKFNIFDSMIIITENKDSILKNFSKKKILNSSVIIQILVVDFQFFLKLECFLF